LAQPAAREYALLQIRGEMMNIAFGQEARHRALATGDKQLSAALGLFDRAAALLKERRELDRTANIRQTVARSR
jgi:hypothetical protein